MTGDRPMRHVGLMSSMEKEIRYFKQRIDVAEEVRVAGLVFQRGTLSGSPVVLVESGMGKVNAALTAALLCERFDCHPLIFCGLAGSLDASILAGDIVIATELIQHDHGDLLESGFRLTQPSVPPHKPSPASVGYRLSPALQERLHKGMQQVKLPALSISGPDRGGRTPMIHYGRVLTGDLFVKSEAERGRLRAAFKALAIEMEGAAVAQVAERFQRTWLVVRSISDHAGADAPIDFGQLSHEAAENAFRIVTALLPRL